MSPPFRFEDLRIEVVVDGIMDGREGDGRTNAVAVVKIVKMTSMLE